MRVLDPGHHYALNVLDQEPSEWDISPVIEQYLYFVKRTGFKYPGNYTAYGGTTMQEVLRACVDRCAYVNKQRPSIWTRWTRALIMLAVWCLEARAAELHGRSRPSLKEAVWGLTCAKCNHVGCRGECH